jgi:hypothetical protein
MRLASSKNINNIKNNLLIDRLHSPKSVSHRRNDFRHQSQISDF